MPSRGRACAWALRGLVALQLAVPLSYYAGLREPDDERFAWRMFSAVRVRTCRVRVRESSAEAEAVRGLHASWVHALERGRRAVITRYLASRCPGTSPILERSCRDAQGVPLPPLTYRYDCAADLLSVEEGARVQ